jgi:hypothetical protein
LANIHFRADNARMGCTLLFECSRCGYRAKVSGGTDRGFHFAVQTIACKDCKELYDAVTDLKVPGPTALSRWKLKGHRVAAARIPTAPPTFQAALNRLMFPGAKRFRWLRFDAVCPVAMQHRVETWQTPGKCPKCGYFLEWNAVPFRRWE